jgi:nucleoside-diphosphate-sugar epimerase
MRVFVTGGTGAIGGYAVPALVGAGHSVSALARSDAKAAVLRGQGAPPARVSLFDRDALTVAYAGHDVVVNLASALPSRAAFVRRSAWRDCDHVRIEGSAAVVDAARRLADGGGGSVILRFGVFYGHDAAHSEQILHLARYHVGFVAGRPTTFISSIHLADAADAVVAALTCAGGTFNLVDDEPLTKRDHAHACAEAVGTKTWLTGPGRLGLLLRERLTSLTRSLRVSNRRFRGETGWTPTYPSVREGYKAMAGACAAP